ncbi:hypothetical protein Mlute_02644 [Meiothermus luteus]|uniref:Lipoprotein n=1 Tax=Meiothermus luteus TaxID=2026184 RepID=A0A399EFW8_9DEIN|nr:hypothetical protein Mlute_02644 [Meiothermus luteus]RMH55958.1 MAG: hypothetical protein D6684_06290 [Deinococcota bacterium]
MGRSLFRFFAVVSLSVLLASCGEQATNEPLSHEDARELKTSFVDSNKYLLAALGNPSNLTTIGGQALPSSVAALVQASNLNPQDAQCGVNVSPTNPPDQDQDGIPAQASFTLDCQETAGSFNFRLRLQDKDDRNPKSGYVLQTDQYELTLYPGTPSEVRIKLDLDLDLTQKNPGYDIGYNFYFEVYKQGKTYSQRHNYTLSYTPDSDENPFLGGTLNYSGNLEYRIPNRYYRLTIDAANLRYAQSCRVSFVGGRVVLRDSRGNQLAIVYNSCNNITATYNGQAL